MNLNKMLVLLIIALFFSMPTAFAFLNQKSLDFFAEDKFMSNMGSDKYLWSFPEKNIDYKKGQLIVKFKESIEIDAQTKKVSVNLKGIYKLSPEAKENINFLNSLNEKKEIKAMERLSKEEEKKKDTPLSNVYIVEIDETADIMQLIKEYENSILVEYAEPNYLVRAFEIPNDPNYSSQWGLEKINISEAYDIEKGDSNIVIAIIDTGVDWNHTELSSKIWSNTGEVEDGNDTDENGYIDDIRGWDFVNTDNNPIDDDGHGTHCSGIAAAKTNNSIGMAGVCWNCTIMPVKCLDDTGSGTYADVALGIEYAANNSVDVISLSLGGAYDSNLVEDAVNYAYSKGVIVIAAAGNEYNDDKHYPAAYDNAFAVTATTTSDSKASFSTYGYWTDIGAPGANIYSTLPNNQYASWDGTSMATPFVAGLAGLLLSKNNSLNPDMIETIIKSTSDPFASSYYMGIGRINAYKALLKTNSTIIAKINDSIKGNTYGGFITINGTANGTYFANYSLYYGSGIYPQTWTHISTYGAAASDENLSVWNTNGLSDGTYTIKLIVNNTDNDFFMDYAVVVLDNNLPQINIISPLNQSYQTPSIWFNTTMNKIGSSCSYSVDGGTNISMDNYSLYNWSGLNTDISNGGHSIVFYCSDSYGNKNLTNPLWFSVSASTISNCSVLDVPNTLYYITADILDSSTTTCINISAENITVECQNHIIDGINTVGTYGVYANNINATIRNCQISNWHYGVYLNDSINSTVYNSVMDSNYYGLYLNYSSNNTIFYNIVKNSSNCGIYLNNSGSNGANNIYNNLLNNTDNTELGGTLYSNNYNITNSGENRIYSIGNDIGGNYYTNSTGNDYSDTCADVDKNGFCDSSYSLDTGNIDHLPLSNKCAYLNISSCSDLSYEGITYNLTTDVSSANTCFSIISNNITLDCNGYTINYSTNYHVDSADGNAVNITNYNGTTIKNCNIIGGGEYDFAIFLNNTNNAKIQDNNITLRGDGGVAAFYSFSNNITNNILRTHTYNLVLYNSSSNNLILNTIKNNSIENVTPLLDFFGINFFGYGIYMESNSYSNIIDENNISMIDDDTLIVYGLYETYSGNTISNNTFFLEGIINIGMNFEYTSSDKIINNSVIITYDYLGISLAYSRNATIKNNTLDIIGFPFVVSGQNSSHFDHIIDTSNTEKGSPIYYFFNQSSLILENLNDVGQIYATYSDNITISNISLQKQGIVFYNINNSVIKNTTINTPGSSSTSSQGIFLIESHNNNISSVFVNTTNGEDIELSHSQNISFTNTTYSDEEVDSYSTLDRYWYLDIFVNYYNGSAVNQSNVRCFDKNNDFVFSHLTSADGTILRQTLRQYNQSGSSKAYFTLFSINATKPNANKNDSIELNLTQSATVTLYLNTLPQIFISCDYTDDSFIEFDFFVNETRANDSFCALDIRKEGAAERTDTLMLNEFSTTDNRAYSLLNKKYEDFYNGNYTINATCYDVFGQSNYSCINFSINDTTNPIFSASVDVSTTGANFSITCNEKIKCTLKSNNEVYSNTEFSKSMTFEMSGLSAGLEYDYNITCFDINNNTREETDSFTTTSVSDDDDTGSTDAPTTGAPQSVINDFASVMHTWDKIEYGKETQFFVSSTRIAIKKIIFYLKETKTGVTLVVKSIDKPTDAMDINEEKYDVKQYMQITAENIEKEDIENITLEVKLAKSEILDTDDVFLLHYTGSYWMKIKPYKVESDGSYYIFFIQINHFSYFAVVQNKPVSTSITEPSNEPSLVEEPENITIVDIDPAPAVDPEPVLEPAVNETDTGIPDEKESNGFLIILIPIFLVILVVGGGLVYYYTLHNHESEDDAEEDDKEDTSFLQELDKIINNSSDTSKAAKVPDKSKDSNYVPFNERVAQQGNVDWYKLQEKSKREHRDIIEHK